MELRLSYPAPQTLCIIFFTLFIATLSTQVIADSSTDEDKFRHYGNLVNNIVFMWNNPFGLNNEELSKQIEDSGVKNDYSDLGKVIRAVLYEITAANTDTPKVPIYDVVRLSESDWNKVKSINAKRYFALKALFILSETANKYPSTSTRLKHSIPQLYELKREALETADPSTVSIASIWLAMEYAELNPLKAVVELEYALPHLQYFNKDYALETVLDKMLAHSWLADAYSRINVLPKALLHQKIVIKDIKEKGEWTAFAYTGVISTLNQLSMFDDALKMANDANLAAHENKSEPQKLFSLWLKVSIYLHRGSEDDRELIAAAMEDYAHSSQVTLPSNVTPANEALAATYQAIHGTDEQFVNATEIFSNLINEKAEDLSYTRRVLLDKYNVLKNIYKLRGDFEKAFFYQREYDQLLVQSRFSLENAENAVIDAPLERDIIISKLHKLARQKDKQNLLLKAQRFQAIAFALFAILLATLLFGFWRAQRKRTRRAERDDLTGAMSRNAMFSAVSKLMASNATSCMVLIDFDYFKQINDRYGHVVGDEVLSTFGGIVRTHIAKNHRFCRYGGEEFLLYLHDTDEKSAYAVLTKIKSALEAYANWKTTQTRFSASFSAGIVEFKKESNITKIIKVCDHLLYKAKSNGRGKIETTTLAKYFSDAP